MKSDSQRRTEALEWFRERCRWLHDDAPMDLELARGIVRASAVWFQKSAGPVPVPGQAEHVTMGLYGWRIYSSNSFELTLFMKAARKILLSAYQDAIDGKPPKPKGLVRPIAWRAHECVSDYNDDLYDHYGHGNFVLAFGSHAIMAQEAARFLIDESGYKKALLWTPGRHSDAGRKKAPTPPHQHPNSQKRLSLQGNATANLPPKGSKDPTKKMKTWVDRTAFDANKKYGPLSKEKKKRLRRLLNKLAPLVVIGAEAPQQERERDELWLQIHQLLNGGAPPASRLPEPPAPPAPPSGA